MLSVGVAVGLIALACGAWAAVVRPTALQREAISRQLRSDLAWLFVPVPAWRSRFLPADLAELGALRRRLLPATAALVGVIGLVVSTLAPIEPRVVDEPIAASEPPPTESTESVEPRRPTLAERERTPLPPPPPADPDEPLEAKRTQPRLFSSAKISTVYKGHDVHGVRIERVGIGSFWDLIGVQSGDVVINMNGSPIDTPAAAVALLNAMERDVVVNLRVRGIDDVERTLYFRVPEK
jgi:hypothetical protein